MDNKIGYLEDLQEQLGLATGKLQNAAFLATNISAALDECREIKDEYRAYSFILDDYLTKLYKEFNDIENRLYDTIKECL